jgi:hypothetical protein
MRVSRASAWWGVAISSHSVTRPSHLGMNTCLLHTCCSRVVRVFINSALQLLQEVVDIQQIVLTPDIGYWQRVRVHGWMGCLRNHGASMPVLGHATTLLVAPKNGELNTLEPHESLADIIVSGRINGTALNISEELVEGIIVGTLSDFVGIVVQLLIRVDSIVHGPIGRILRWATIEAARSAPRMGLSIASVVAHATVRVLISTRCSGKCLQVSDDCVCKLEQGNLTVCKERTEVKKQSLRLCDNGDGDNLRLPP